jgi:hypothetical protein
MIGLWYAIGGVLALAVIVVWALTVSDIIRRHLGRGPTAAWLLIVVLLPFLGSVIYWMRRQPSADEIERQFDSERALRDSARQRPFDSTSVGP